MRRTTSQLGIKLKFLKTREAESAGGEAGEHDLGSARGVGTTIKAVVYNEELAGKSIVILKRIERCAPGNT